jgi:hypothetical protein
MDMLQGHRVATILKRESETQQVEKLCPKTRLLDARLHGVKDRDLDGLSETYWTLSPAAGAVKNGPCFT